MNLTYNYIPHIYHYADPTIKDLQENVMQLDAAIHACNENIWLIAETIEQIIDIKIKENTRKTYNVLFNLNKIDNSEEEFINLIREEK